MMSETQTTESKSTTVTVTSAKAEPSMPAGISININYFKSIQGILKIIILILALIIMACASPQLLGATKFMMFVVAICFIITFIFLLVHFVSLPVAFPRVPWLVIELLYCVLAGGAYLLSAIIHLAISENYHYQLSAVDFWTAYIAAGSIAIINGLLYGVASFFLFQDRRALQT